jgi:hypothetical protein
MGNPVTGIIVMAIVAILGYYYWLNYGRYTISLGGLDMVRYCKGKGGEDAWTRENAWYCKYPGKDVYATLPLTDGDFTAACQQQYNNPNAKGFNTSGGTKSWTCWAKPQ